MSALGPSPYQSLFDTTIGELCRGDDGCTISEVTTANSDHGDTPFFEAAAVGENCRRSPLWRHKGEVLSPHVLLLGEILAASPFQGCISKVALSFILLMENNTVKNVLHYYELDQSRHSVSKQKR